MKNIVLCLLLSIFSIYSGTLLAQQNAPKVVMQTIFGDIVIEVYPDQAPVTVENFLQYVNTGFYDSLVFHRVDNNPTYSIIQAGGYYVIENYIYLRQPDREPIINESYNVSNLRGTIAMARTSEPHSATSQFFINHTDNVLFDRANYADGYGYCVFGQVTSGMDVVDTIADMNTINVGGGLTQFPYPPIVTIYEATLDCPGYWLSTDLNNDGIANLCDFAVFSSSWQKQADNLAGDLDDSGKIDSSDLALFAKGWLRVAVWYRAFPGDLNNNKTVDFRDFSLLASEWQQTEPELLADIDLNGTVNIFDLMRFSEDWLKTTD